MDTSSKGQLPQKAKMDTQEIRRAIVREWMVLPSDERHTEEQAAGFTTKAMQHYELPHGRRDPHRTIMGWLLARKGKSA